MYKRLPCIPISEVSNDCKSKILLIVPLDINIHQKFTDFLDFNRSKYQICFEAENSAPFNKKAYVFSVRVVCSLTLKEEIKSKMILTSCSDPPQSSNYILKRRGKVSFFNYNSLMHLLDALMKTSLLNSCIASQTATVVISEND